MAGAFIFFRSLFFLFVLNLIRNSNAFKKNFDQYDVISSLPYVNLNVELMRTRRESSSTYQSLQENATEISNLTQQVLKSKSIDLPIEFSTIKKNISLSYSQAKPNNLSTSFLESTFKENITSDLLNDISNKKNSVFNETRQMKNFPVTYKSPVVSEPITSTPIKTNTAIKKVLSEQDLSVAQDKNIDDIFNSVDITDSKTREFVKNQNLTFKEENHIYYNSTQLINEAAVKISWEILRRISPNQMLSTSYRRAITVQLTFDFPFYGHPVRNITVATGGFLYTGEYVHSWLAATQYIAPLMANFDTSLLNDSFVRYDDNGTAFNVLWENVILQDKPEGGKFTFGTTLHKNGDIVFTYFKMPIKIEAIHDDKHPVKVGLSDAYIMDKVIFFARRKTIYEYHRVTFHEQDIQNNTIIYLRALPTCLTYTDCESCINHNTTFGCTWCPGLNKCSTGTDRKRHDWIQKGCERSVIKDTQSCPVKGTKGSDVSFPVEPNNSIDNENFNGSMYNTLNKNASNEHLTGKKIISGQNLPIENLNNNNKKINNGLAIGLMIPVSFITIILIWMLYAYRNPHTKSGQLLIQYRPTQWSWRRGEARYTAATIHM